MTTAEIPFHQFSRRDLIGIDFFSKRKHSDAKLHKSSSRTTQTRPQGPRFTRPKFIVGGLAIVATIALGLSKPWEQSNYQEAQDNTLESLVAQARKMENDFKDNTLTDEGIRNRFVNVLANIFSKDAHSSWSGKQIAESVIWTSTTDDFIKKVKANSYIQRNVGPDYFKNVSAITTDNHKVVVNLSDPSFNTALLRRGGFSQDWNALKVLRGTLMHEFLHLTVIPRKDPQFFNMTDLPKDIEDAQVEGFLLTYSEKGRPREAFNLVQELALETITNDRCNRLFGFTPILPYIDLEKGADLKAAQPRFRQVLTAFYGFVLALSAKVQFSSDATPINRINYVLDLFDAIIFNNPRKIQEHISRTARN